jgi:glycosyltransferase involved in cell wall biosynthesis
MMGEHNRKRGNIPYLARSPQIIKSKMIQAPPQVHTTSEITISDKAICFVGPAHDCCVDKVIKEYVPYFEKEGYQIIFTLQKGMQDIIRFAPRWVVLFRAGTDPGFNQELGMPNATKIIQHLKRLGVRIVYYIDDFLVAANGNAPIQLASQCDAVIVATTELKKFFKSLSNFSVPIIHVPTHVDLPVFDFLPKLDYIQYISRYKVLITSGGRVGALLTHDMCQLANERWQEFDDVEWIINAAGVSQMRTLINSFRNLHKTYIDWTPLDAYYSLCKSVNVILHPASKEDIATIVPPAWHDTWLNSKSAVKYTMSGAASIPIISSPSLSYTESIKEGETGYVVNTAEEFLNKILYLKNNPEIANKVGKQARKDVEAN